jgi:hypothetical protein
MIKELTTIWRGANPSGATAGFCHVPITEDGTIVGVQVLSKDPISGGAAPLTVSKNGVNVPGLAMLMSNASDNVSAGFPVTDPVSIAVVKGDDIVLNLTSNMLISPVTFTVFVDDGVDEAQTIRDTLLTGISLVSTAAVTAGNKIIEAAGRLQAQINVIFASLNNKFNTSDVDTDGAAAANSDAKVMSQKAVRTYVSNNSGASLPAGDLNSATNKVEKVQGRTVYVPVNSPLGETFTGNVYSTAMWSKHASISVQNNRLEWLANVGNTFQSVQTDLNFTGKFISFQPVIGTGDGAIKIFQGSSHITAYLNGNDATPNVSLEVNNFNSAVFSQTVNVSKANMAYVRIREAANIWYLDTSADGTTWTQRIVSSGTTWAGTKTAVRVQFYSTGTGFVLDNINSDIAVTDPLTDGSSIIWSAANSRFETKTPAEQAAIIRPNLFTTVPATAASTGTAGQMAYDANYFYICTAANTWKRVAIATF